MKKHQLTLLTLLIALGGSLSYQLTPLMQGAGKKKPAVEMGTTTTCNENVKLGFEQKVVANMMREHQKMIVIMLDEKKAQRALQEEIKHERRLVIPAL